MHAECHLHAAVLTPAPCGPLPSCLWSSYCSSCVVVPPLLLSSIQSSSSARRAPPCRFEILPGALPLPPVELLHAMLNSSLLLPIAGRAHPHLHVNVVPVVSLAESHYRSSPSLAPLSPATRHCEDRSHTNVEMRESAPCHP
jgi:hypothetical protein